MPRLGSLALVAVAAVSTTPVVAGESWVRARTPHFEVLTDAGEAPARAAALRLEGLRDALLTLLPGGEVVRRPITVVLLENRGRFATLVPRDHARGTGVAGFFLGGSGRDYAVAHLSSEQLRPFEAVEHEYAHLILNSSLPAQPLWVAEGLAELLSDGVLAGGEARFGASRPDYEERLQATGVSVERLISLGYDAAEYRGFGEGGQLYAEAWALARWVVHHRGLGGMQSYLDAVASGLGSAEAFTQELGSLSVAEATLLQVPANPLLRVAVAGARGRPPKVDSPTVADVEQRLAEVLLRGGHSSEARRRLARALEADPSHVPARTSLGDILVRQGEWDAARDELEAVLAADPGHPEAVLSLASLELGRALDEGVPLEPEVETRIVDSLEEVLARAPELTEAALLLAALRPQPYATSIARLEPLFEQQPDRVELARTLSGLYMKTSDVAAARRVLERAREAARSDAIRHLFEVLLARLEGFRSGTDEVRGDLIHVKCRPDGSLLFTISADPRNVRLEAATTRSFFVHGADGLGAEARVLCGEQDRPVSIRYEPLAGADPEADGRLLWLTFEE